MQNISAYNTKLKYRNVSLISYAISSRFSILQSSHRYRISSQLSLFSTSTSSSSSPSASSSSGTSNPIIPDSSSSSTTPDTNSEISSIANQSTAIPNSQSSTIETNTASEAVDNPSSDKGDESAEPSPERRRKQRFSGPLSWKAFFMTTLVGIMGLVFFRRAEERQTKEMSKGQTFGRIAIGGPYDLINENNERVTSESFKDAYQLIYFGFTNCPDICPTEMKKMEEVLKLYNQLPMHAGNPVVPIFISIDPRRDTPKRLQEYRKGYIPEFVWLTGPDEEIRKVARAFRVFYSAPETLDENEDYLMEHTIFFYLTNRNGEVVDYYGKILTANEIFRRLVKTIQEDSQSVKK